MNIGIIGAKSYIGRYFSSFIHSEKNYCITFINSRNGDWKKLSFNKFDVLLHVAGIAHISTDIAMKKLYYEINRDLPIALAKKAKVEGVKHFVFFSSILVYGDDLPINRLNIINSTTTPKPSNYYGKSKLAAENGLTSLQDSSFNISIIRLPMVYGKGCKGNFPRLIYLASKLPIFPDIANQRSMINIDNLCAYLKMVIDNKVSGFLFPQNSEYVSTKDIILKASIYTNHRIRFIKIFNLPILLLSLKIDPIRRMFGSKVYDKSMSPDMQSYNIFSFEESMKRYFL